MGNLTLFSLPLCIFVIIDTPNKLKSFNIDSNSYLDKHFGWLKLQEFWGAGIKYLNNIGNHSSELLTFNLEIHYENGPFGPLSPCDHWTPVQTSSTSSLIFIHSLHTWASLQRQLIITLPEIIQEKFHYFLVGQKPSINIHHTICSLICIWTCFMYMKT